MSTHPSATEPTNTQGEAPVADQPKRSIALSLWHDDAGVDWTPAEPLAGDLDVDVAIVGGGYTGLWTAYYLAKTDPGLRVAVLEKNFVGFGASGRNGGWCSAIFPATMRKVAASSSGPEAVRMQQAMFDTVDEIGNVVATEGIDCDFGPVATCPWRATRRSGPGAGRRSTDGVPGGSGRST